MQARPVAVLVACAVVLCSATAMACEFSDASVCEVCAVTNNQTCAEAVADYCNPDWTNAGCADARAGCPFALTTPSGPASPCTETTCSGDTPDATACLSHVAAYCSYQLAHDKITDGFGADSACLAVVIPSCQAGEVLDCNGECAALGRLGDGVCDDNAAGVDVHFNCSLFDNDGGDCASQSTCEFADASVCAECASDAGSADCVASVADYCDSSDWEDSSCPSTRVACPFDATSGIAGTDSPCEASVCAGASPDAEQCIQHIAVYCTAHLVARQVGEDVVFDAACDLVVLPGCGENEVVDCDGACAPITALGDGTCHDGAGDYNFNCPDFASDAADCPDAGECEFSDAACAACASDPASADCVSEVADHCTTHDWDTAACQDTRVECPFESSDGSGPVSPCASANCTSASADGLVCASVIGAFCQHRLARERLDGSPTDPACSSLAFNGCNSGELYDCDAQCSAASSLADGVCDDGTSGRNFYCAEFDFDGSDCDPTCEFDSKDVCDECEADATTDGCVTAIVDHCAAAQWQSPSCASTLVECPFVRTAAFLPPSPCSVPACTSAPDHASCVGALVHYCLANRVFERLNASFTADPACASFRPPPGCEEGEIYDCAGACAPLLSLRDTTCDDGIASPYNFTCRQFAFDGGDCRECPFDDETVCEQCILGRSRCDSALHSYCDVTGWDTPPCDIFRVGCPFAPLGSGVVTSPCASDACTTNADHGACVQSISTYCAHEMAQHALDSGFAYDAACDAVTPPDCALGEWPDCSGNCADLSTLGDGNCDGEHSDTNFRCDVFLFDGGDCPETLSPSPSRTPSHTPSHTATISQSPSHTATISESPSHTATISESPSHTATISESPSHTATISQSPSHTATISQSPSHTASVSQSPSHTPSVSQSPSHTPSVSQSPSHTPSVSQSPSHTPSVSTSAAPSVSLTSTGSLSSPASASPSPTASVPEATVSATPSVSGEKDHVDGSADLVGVDEDEFNESGRGPFRRTVARTSDTEEDNVEITDVQPLDTKAGGIRVDYTISLPPSTTEALATIVQRLSNATSLRQSLNEQFESDGVAITVTEVRNAQAAAMQDQEEDPEDDDDKGSSSDTPLVAGVAVGVVGGAVVLGALVFALLRVKKHKSEDEVAKGQAVELTKHVTGGSELNLAEVQQVLPDVS